VIALLLTAPRAAQGIVVPPVEAVHDVPLPANGVLLFTGPGFGGGEVVQVTGVDGPVPGTASPIEGYLGWRADSPPEPGAYTVTMAEDVYFAAPDQPLAVIEPYQPQAHQLNLVLALSNVASNAGEVVCCEPDAETKTIGRGCFYTQVTQVPELHVFAPSPLIPAHAAQYLYRIVDSPGDALSSAYSPRPPLNAFARVEPAEEYCVTVEAFSLIDEQTFTTTSCTPHALAEPTLEARTDYSGAFGIGDCPQPPDGWDETWCEVVSPFCSRASFEEDIELCQTVYELCDVPEPEPTPASEGPDAGVIGAPDSGTPQPAPGQPEAAAAQQEPRDPSTFACSCDVPARGALDGRAGSAGLLLLALAALRRRSRQRQSS
jgi:hypothetical protein